MRIHDIIMAITLVTDMYNIKSGHDKDCDDWPRCRLTFEERLLDTLAQK